MQRNRPKYQIRYQRTFSDWVNALQTCAFTRSRWNYDSLLSNGGRWKKKSQLAPENGVSESAKPEIISNNRITPENTNTNPEKLPLKKLAGGTNIPNFKTLSDVHKNKPKEEKPGGKEEEEEGFKENRAVNISLETLDTKLKELIQIWEEKKYLSLCSVLKESVSKIDFNKWTIRIHSGIHEQILISNRDMILGEIRKHKEMSELYMEIIIDTSLQPTVNLPLNAVEKFQLMAEKNPNLLHLQKIFNIRIID